LLQRTSGVHLTNRWLSKIQTVLFRFSEKITAAEIGFRREGNTPNVNFAQPHEPSWRAVPQLAATIETNVSSGSFT
jgi:hypothetical protein